MVKRRNFIKSCFGLGLLPFVKLKKKFKVVPYKHNLFYWDKYVAVGTVIMVGTEYCLVEHCEKETKFDVEVPFPYLVYTTKVDYEHK